MVRLGGVLRGPGGRVATWHSRVGEAGPHTRRSGGWTLYVDEFQLLGDQRMFRLGSRVERRLITARKEGTSVGTSFQAMAWVPKAAVPAATAFRVLFATRARATTNATAQGMGLDPRP